MAGGVAAGDQQPGFVGITPTNVEAGLCGSGLVWEPGLPAMQAPRCVSDTKVMLSQASQLPHKLSSHIS